MSSAPTSTSVITSGSPSVFGQDVSFTATVSADAPSTATPAGSVQFKVDGNDLGGPVALVSGQATSIETSTLAVGDHSITAVFTDAGSFDGSTSDAITQSVGSVGTLTSVQSSGSPSVFGGPVSFTATVSADAPSSATPVGSVQFKVDGSDFGGPVALVSGQATSIETSTLAVGNHTVDAVFVDAGDFDGSTGSLSGGQDVTSVATSTVVVSSDDSSVFGQDVTFTATVSAANPSLAIPAGSVEFFDGVTSLGSDTLDGSGQGSVHTAGLAVGSHGITAVFSDAGDFDASTSPVLTQTVGSVATSTVVVSSDDSSVFGQDVTFTATVSADAPSTATPVGSVEFFDGVSSLGAAVALDSNGEAQLSTAALSVGSHDITAVFTDAGDFDGSTSDVLTQSVSSAPTSTSVITSGSPSVFGQDVSFTATVSADAPSTATPAGSVEFFDGVTSLGSDTLDGSGQGSVHTAGLAVGSHDITAVFSDAGDFGGSTSPVLTQTVNLASTTTTITGSVPDPSVVGQDYVVSVSVAPVAPGAGVPSGTVHVSDSDGNGCDVTLSGGSGSCTLPSDSAGTKTLDAHYQGDAGFDTSDATSVSHQVDAAATTTVVIYVGQPVGVRSGRELHGDGVGGCSVVGDSGRFGGVLRRCDESGFGHAGRFGSGFGPHGGSGGRFPRHHGRVLRRG